MIPRSRKISGYLRLTSTFSRALVCTLLLSGYANAAGDQAAIVDATAKGKPLLWPDYMELINQGRDFAQYATIPLSDEAVAQYFLMALSNAYALLYRADPYRPEFSPFANHVFNIAGPNPDTTYYFATLDGNSKYRIVGQRGSVHMIDFQTGYDWLGFKTTPGRAFPSTSIDDYVIDQDGHFEILLSGDKPKSHSGNWLKLDERVNYLLVRQISYTAEETNALLAIELIEKSSRQTAAVNFEEKFKKMADFSRNSTRFYLGYLQSLAKDEVINRMRVMDYDAVGGVHNQIYHQGLYDIKLEEALIVKAKVPAKCDYWNIQVTDRLWQTLEPVYSQSSLNGRKSRSDKDGFTRFVLSHRDPGVANWIDLNRVEQGYMVMRWLGCSSPPEQTTKKINFADVRQSLPRDTQAIGPLERQQAILARALARQLRRDW
ncbi:MAG: DUF1214 domain-containing protein [Halieaceae bacterium]|nr:DUF1214 domain-containing protein [Halieaceae bacterium]